MRPIALVLALALLLPPVASASQAHDADAREVSAYQLTEPGLGKFTRATRGLIGLHIDECAEEADVKTISEAVAKLDATCGREGRHRGGWNDDARVHRVFVLDDAERPRRLGP